MPLGLRWGASDHVKHCFWRIICSPDYVLFKVDTYGDRERGRRRRERERTSDKKQTSQQKIPLLLMFLWSQGEEVEKWETLNFSLCTLVKNSLNPESATGVARACARAHTHTYTRAHAYIYLRMHRPEARRLFWKIALIVFTHRHTHTHLWQALILKQFS